MPAQIGGDTEQTLYPTVPRFRLEDVEVYSSSFEERLDEPAIHLPDTGFPRQPGANTYIAGYRVGYFGTGSFLVFVRLNELSAVDEVILEDPAGGKCAYRVTGSLVVEPEDASVMEPAPGKSIVSLRPAPSRTTLTASSFAESSARRRGGRRVKAASTTPASPRSRRNRYQTRPSP